MNTECIDVNSLLAKAEALSRRDDEAALDCLMKANKLEPDNPSILASIGGKLNVRLGRYDESLPYYDQVLEIQPKHEWAKIDRALVLARQGDFTTAIDEMNEVLSFARDERTFYQAACLCAIVNNERTRRRAINLLVRALGAGYSNGSIAKDSDLKNVLQEADFDTVESVYEMLARLNQ